MYKSPVVFSTSRKTVFENHRTSSGGSDPMKTFAGVGCIRGIPIIAITADAMPENLKACKLAGMNDCLTKPASLAAVREIIQKWLPVAGETSAA